MVEAEDVEKCLRQQSPPEASIKAIALDMGEPPDQVRRTVERMATWGVCEIDDGVVTLVDDETVLPEEASDMPCPLGCGYRPTTGRGAFVHLLAHAVGRHSTGDDQQQLAQ